MSTSSSENENPSETESSCHGSSQSKVQEFNNISTENPSNALNMIKLIYSENESSSSNSSFADPPVEVLKCSTETRKRPNTSSLSSYGKTKKFKADNISTAESVKPAENSDVVTRLEKELQEITNDAPPYIIAYLKTHDNLREWEAFIRGPPESPYEGGTFLLDINFPPDYPFEPPKVIFMTKIYHCNINSKGCVGLDILHEKWSPALSATQVLLSIQALLTDCYPEDPLVPEIAKQYVNNREEHYRICREWTKKYASDESEMYPCLL